MAALIAVEVGCAAGADAGHVVDRRCPDTTAGSSDPSGRAAATMRDCRPSAHSASSWSPESTTMRCGSAAHLGLTRGVADRRVGGPSSSGRGFGRTRLVGPALVAQHAGTRDLGGAGDGAIAGAASGGFVAAQRSAAADRSWPAPRRSPPPRPSDPRARPLNSTSPTVTSGQLAGRSGRASRSPIYDSL